MIAVTTVSSSSIIHSAILPRIPTLPMFHSTAITAATKMIVVLLRALLAIPKSGSTNVVSVA